MSQAAVQRATVPRMTARPEMMPANPDVAARTMSITYDRIRTYRRVLNIYGQRLKRFILLYSVCLLTPNCSAVAVRFPSFWEMAARMACLSTSSRLVTLSKEWVLPTCRESSEALITLFSVRITAFSMAYCNSLMFPGQGWLSSF